MFIRHLSFETNLPFKYQDIKPFTLHENGFIVSVYKFKIIIIYEIIEQSGLKNGDIKVKYTYFVCTNTYLV